MKASNLVTSSPAGSGPAVTLYQLPRAYGLPVSVSPFCVKLEAYFRLAGIDYVSKLGEHRRAPLGKLPYIEFEGRLMGDSGLIIEWAQARFGDRLDGSLTQDQRLRGLLIRRAFEEHLYFGLLYSRFIDERGWEQQAPVLAGMLPRGLGRIAGPVVLRIVRANLRAQGLGRLTRHQVYSAAAADVFAAAAELGPRPYLFGDEPTSFDCVVYGMMQHVLVTPFETALTDAARSAPGMKAYVARMRDRLGFD